MVVKVLFFLHPSTTDHLLYAKPRDGGLGFPRLSQAYPLIFLRHGLKLLEGRPLPLLERLLEINHFEGRLAAVARSIEVDWPISLQGLTRTKQKLLREESRSWAGLVSQGHGVGAFRNDTLGRCWLRNPAYLSASRHVNALKMRTNTLGTRVACKSLIRSLVQAVRHKARVTRHLSWVSALSTSWLLLAGITR